MPLLKATTSLFVGSFVIAKTAPGLRLAPPSCASAAFLLPAAKADSSKTRASNTVAASKIFTEVKRTSIRFTCNPPMFRSTFPFGAPLGLVNSTKPLY